MNVFISGGCKNGKSMYAQNLACEAAREKDCSLYYLATMKPVDDEDLARIERHLEEREGLGFITVEQSMDICGCLKKKVCMDSMTMLQQVDTGGVFLLDSVTALLSNEMFREDGSVDMAAPSRVAGQLKQFAALTGNTIFISDYIYSDAMKYDDLTEAYRKGLAFIDRTLAEVCGQVIEVSFGQLIYYTK
ncbi:bifunctional adenosylcobinamide kinase/adenosylcobinamide-phosphate guanylyltransferase [Clostridium aminobutyricum]|uniref:Adenosylcobinamide kinase n=1 Tax=Clostridium aminobutyricum TaxID=33953 RepID=A0A939DAY9_CLOAM|nr:bifunctional adenosylcobinamide kinase/adenosylcobinamide-phosphate guanylyltransferase [Clostridium aminobutyricum]MBN7774365.1 bifunctional adenosylcobinamide kinase/adenosylcobinamide-phosphate guanylyltransferase [Clostridium aminobutyricum]